MISSDYFPFFISARGNNREWFALPLEYVYGLYANGLETTIKKYQISPKGLPLDINPREPA